MSSRRIAGLFLALAFLTTACQDRMPTEPTATSVESFSEVTAAMSSIESTGISLERTSIVLPPGARMGHDAFDMLGRAINPDDYECSGTTAISDWWLSEALSSQAQEPAIFNLLYFSLLADLVVFYDALYFLTDDAPQSFGYNGEYTKVLEKTHKDAARFWDIESEQIQLISMKGTMLQDMGRVANVYNQIFGVPAPVAASFAALVHDAITSSQTLDGGNHPLFSFNAVAITTFGGSIPDKIVMGDGIMAGYAALGFGDVAPQAIHMHEYAHHIQFQNGYFNDAYRTSLPTAAERTRYTELMADAMSAYYLTHKRGATMNAKRVRQFLEVFYQIGDCSFASNGHHGTPNQRMAAAEWGFDLADKAQKQGHILSSHEVYEAFLAAYPDLIAPDAP